MKKDGAELWLTEYTNNTIAFIELAQELARLTGLALKGLPEILPDIAATKQYEPKNTQPASISPTKFIKKTSCKYCGYYFFYTCGFYISDHSSGYSVSGFRIKRNDTHYYHINISFYFLFCTHLDFFEPVERFSGYYKFTRIIY